MKDGRLKGISCFAGVAGLDLAIQEDVRTVCYIEWDKYCQEVLKKRMQEGWLDDAPIWGDICSFDGRRWAGKVDIVFGGFPCQDISVAGKGAGIKEGTRSGLWFEMYRIIQEVRPRFIFLENVSAITRRGLSTVLGCLNEAGYDARWTTVKASDVGAPHKRERWFCLSWNNIIDDKSVGEIQKRQTANTTGICRTKELSNSISLRESQSERSKQNKRGWTCDSSNKNVAYPFDNTNRPEGRPLRETEIIPRINREALCSRLSRGAGENMADSELRGWFHRQTEKQSAEGGEHAQCEFKPKSNNVSDCDTTRLQGNNKEKRSCGESPQELGWCGGDPAEQPSTSESYVGRVAHGIPKRVDRLKCLGNAVVPQQGRQAWKILTRGEA